MGRWVSLRLRPAPFQVGSSPGKLHCPPRRRRQARFRTRVVRRVPLLGIVLGQHSPGEGRGRAGSAARAQTPPRLGAPSQYLPCVFSAKSRPHRRRARTAWDGEARLGRRASRGSGTDASGLPGAAPREVGGGGGGGAAVVEVQRQRKRPRATQVPYGALLSPHASPSSRLVACCLPTAALPGESFRSAVAEKKPSPPRLEAE